LRTGQHLPSLQFQLPGLARHSVSAVLVPEEVDVVPVGALDLPCAASLCAGVTQTVSNRLLACRQTSPLGQRSQQSALVPVKQAAP
jgi:hypothetical protein